MGAIKFVARQCHSKFNGTTGKFSNKITTIQLTSLSLSLSLDCSLLFSYSNHHESSFSPSWSWRSRGIILNEAFSSQSLCHCPVVSSPRNEPGKSRVGITDAENNWSTIGEPTMNFPSRVESFNFSAASSRDLARVSRIRRRNYDVSKARMNPEPV